MEKKEKKSELRIALEALWFVLLISLPAIMYCIGILFFWAE